MEIKNRILSLGVFEDNEFLDKYCTLIVSNMDTKQIEGVTNNHHIVPKSYFILVNVPIDNSEENLVHLTYENHIIAHYYLCLFTSDGTLKSKMVYAFMMMTHIRTIPESEQELLQNLNMYNYLHNEWISHLSSRMKGNQLAKGNVLSEETRRQMSISRMGHGTSEDTRTKLSKANQGSIWIHKDGIYKHISSQNINAYLDDGWELGGKPVSKKQKQAISVKNKGKKRSDESRKKMSEVAKGRQPWNKGIPQSDSTKAKNSDIHKNRVHINNGTQGKMVPIEEVQIYLDNGWIKGRLKWLQKSKVGGDTNE